MKILGIIPARFGSTRFPGKPLIDILGKTMIQRVFMQVSKSKMLEEVLVATDDQRIYDHVFSFGGNAIMTSPHHTTGTERCAEVLTKNSAAYDMVVNIQGDEPFIKPAQIDSLARFMCQNPQMNIGTLATVIKDEHSIFNPNHIKVVFDKNGKVLYFSRSPIPFLRNTKKENWLKENDFFKHIGMYAYHANALKTIAKLPKSNLEIAESLEQLRWMENGFSVGIIISEEGSQSIDTPDDLENLLETLKK